MDITSANSSFILSVPDVFVVPQVLQGYATDDAFATEETEIKQTVMGVDGVMSAGYMPAIFPMTITLQADSASILETFEAWRSAEAAARTPYFASAQILIPSIGIQYQFPNGVLQRATPTPHAKKVLEPVTYRIHWDGYTALPMA